MQFCDVDDLSEDQFQQRNSKNKKEKEKLKPPKTAQQIVREDYIAKLEDDKKLQSVSEEERQKTIKCLLQIMDMQLMQVEEQARDIQEHNKRTENDMKEYERGLRKQEELLKLDEMKCELERAEKIAGGFKKSKKVCFKDESGDIQMVETDSEDDEDQTPVDVADLLADNEVLIARVDQALKEEDPTYGQSESNDTLTSTAIDDLYEQCVAQKKRDNYVNSKKKVLYPVTGPAKTGVVMPTRKPL